MTTAYINGANHSTDEPEYLYVETQADGGVWFEVNSGGRSLFVELDADAVKQLREALDAPS